MELLPLSYDLSSEEFLKHWARINEILIERVQQTKEEFHKSDKSDTGLVIKYFEASKDLYAFARLMRLTGNLSKQVQLLRLALGVAEHVPAEINVILPVTKKEDLN